VAEVFPELADKFHRDMRGVTLLHLFRIAPACAQSGPRALSGRRREGTQAAGCSRRTGQEAGSQARQQLRILKPSVHHAGAVVERITGKTWRKRSARKSSFAEDDQRRLRGTARAAKLTSRGRITAMRGDARERTAMDNPP